MNSLVRFALGLANVPSEMVAHVDAALPGMARLIDAAKQLEPYLEQTQPHIEALTPHLTAIAPHVTAMIPHLQQMLPLIERALPIIKAEYPDIVALLPTAQEIITFVGDKKKSAVPTVPDPSKSGSG